MLELLNGAFEMHVHTAPDVSPRKCDDLELARRFQAAGLGGALIKCHYGDTSARAAVLNQLYPHMRFFGGVTLNNAAGGLNPHAVAVCGKMGGRAMWFPTMDARHYRAFHKKTKPETDLTDTLTVFDSRVCLKDEAVEVLKESARYHLMTGTGHLGPQEALALAEKGAELGCTMVMTHADNPANGLTIAEQKEAVKMGAVIEHCFFTTFYKKTPIEEIAAQIRAVGVENVFLCSDFGQVASPFSDEGLEMYARLLLDQGFSQAELRHMFRTLPMKLLGIGG